MADTKELGSPGLIAVVGASGNIGRKVVHHLAERQCQIRALGTDTVHLDTAVPTGVEVKQLDLTDPSTFLPALAGVDALFLVRPPSISRIASTIAPFLHVAQHQGVRHVVFSSVAGAETNRLLPHYRIEQELMASSMSWTMLRPGFFAQNFADAYRDDIVEDARVYVPAAEGRVAFIDAADIGEVAAAILAEGRFENLGLHLTGPEAVTFNDALAAFGSVMGQHVAYEPASAIGYLRHLVRRRGLSVGRALIQTVLHVGLRRGDAELVTGAVEEVLGCPARSLTEYFEDAADLWATQPTASS